MRLSSFFLIYFRLTFKTPNNLLIKKLFKTSCLPVKRDKAQLLYIHMYMCIYFLLLVKCTKNNHRLLKRVRSSLEMGICLDVTKLSVLLNLRTSNVPFVASNLK